MVKSPRPYQAPTVAWLSKKRRAIVVAPAGSGKTLIAAFALWSVINAKPRDQLVKVGWLANTKDQVDQGLVAMNEVFGADLDRYVDLRLACMTPGLNWYDRDVLVVDECHHTGAAEWNRQVNTCPNARWGLTATPAGADTSLFNHEVRVIDRSEVGSALCKATVVMLDPEPLPGLGDWMKQRIEKEVDRRQRFWRGDVGELTGIVAWQVIVEHGIVRNDARTQAALRAIVSHREQPTLVLVNLVEHGERIAASVQGSMFVHAKVGASSRRAILDKFRRGELKTLVATSLADEGLDLPMAEVLVLVSGGKSRTKAEQRTGRVLRSYAGKTGALIYDFADSFHPTMERHAQKRVALYRELGYEVRFT